MMEEKNVFTGKTYDEAVNNACMELGLSRNEMEITVLEEGKKKFLHSTDWKISAKEKLTDGARAAEFINGLLKILQIPGESKIVSEEESVRIEIETESGARVIGKRGEVLDAIQTVAGAVANIGREQYMKVVVDCQNYRAQREETLVELAHKVEMKAVKTGRKVMLEPMNPYDRRIIHSALLESAEVKTASEGKEPQRYVVVIPNGAKPNDKGIRFGDRGDRFDKGRRERGGRTERKERTDKGRRPERFENGGKRHAARPSDGAKRAKKEIHLGTFLGNSGNNPANSNPGSTGNKTEE